MEPSLLYALGAALLHVSFVAGQEECEQGGCYPATGDLLVGRESKLTASSTCGLQGRTKYCIVSFLTGRASDKCFLCDSSPEVERRGLPYSHLPKNMVTRSPQQRLQTWWQAENGVQNVTLQLDLEAEFVFTHLIMTFRSFRPKAMYVERSWTYGRRWSVYRYFAENCARSFPSIPMGPQKNIDDVVCEERYSSIEPSTEGEVVLTVLDPVIQIQEDPYSLRVQNLLKLTNLRVHFTELHTLGDDIIGESNEVNQKYFYALYEMVVRGSCSCYGHAEQCIPLEGDPTDVDMVYGNCNCTHNTMGRNCEMCKAEYNDQPWKPAYKDQLNVCQKCNCNSHSRKCHFDLAVYNATNGVSGGVCDDCLHNTTGRQCELCKPLFYRDPFKNIFDPDVCKPCDCDPSGSFGGGECETITDPGQQSLTGELGTVAGRCICKKNVIGRRCDTCKDGFWKLLESNPDGCQSCGCDPRGTVARNQCVQETGVCRCKRFVAGATCSKCVERFWDLGSTQDGCRPCLCDVGGARSDVCDDITGSCSCRPNIIGRQCDQVRPGYYFAVPDQNLFEGEDTVSLAGPHAVERRIPDPSQVKNWTGDGFVRVQKGSRIEFPKVRVPTSGDYNILIRYDSQASGNWDDVRVRLVREDGGRLGGGDCPELRDVEKVFYPKLPNGGAAVLVKPSVCLEKGVVYKIQVEFRQNTGSGDVLIDSIVLIPSVESVKVFQGRDGAQRRATWDRLGCDQYFHKVADKGSLPEECRKLLFSISAEANNGALPCQCDVVGTQPSGQSEILTCSAAGGQCPCKAGVVGHRCNKCAPGYFGFGPQGCRACNCSSVGSNSPFCDEANGQCSCKANLAGRKCDLCPSNHYGYPNCRPCRCNGHSSTCDPVTGRCTDCRDNTDGKNCEVCADGFFGDATKGTPKDCQQCQCPGGSGGNQFASTCQQDDQGIICIDCLPGYTGRQCEKCDDGYYGNPIVAGGRCDKCDCSGNVDPFAVGKCDSVNGNCYNCLHNTAGAHCEKCKPGFFGNARNQTCTACVCNPLGTDPAGSGICNPVTGQCTCLKNVEGVECDRCASGFYNMASSTGCQSCGCDKDGSLEGNCNLLDGQCKCRVGFGGRDCSQCEDLFWGNPKASGCKACRCNPAGSASPQCDRTTGVCRCKPNVIGDHCDMCAARTSGVMPECEDCHPCNHDWEDIIAALERNVTYLILKGSSNSTYNASEIQAYRTEIQFLRNQLDAIGRILDSGSVTAADVDNLRAKLDQFRKDLIGLDRSASARVGDVERTKSRVVAANDDLDGFALKTRLLKSELEEMVKNATKVVESNIGGALNSTRDSLRRSRAAQNSVDDVAETIRASKKLRKSIRKEIMLGEPELDDLHRENVDFLKNLSGQVTALDAELKRLNGLLCGDADACGGCNVSGCDSCGDRNGCDGVKHLALRALQKAEEAKQALLRKEARAKDVHRAVEDARLAVNASKVANDAAAKLAHDAERMGEHARNNITILIKDIVDFLNHSFYHPNKSRLLAEETLKLNISLTPAEIQSLADAIKTLVRNLTGVDAILNATKEDSDLASRLKEEALRVKEFALNVMSEADNVLAKLGKAAATQNYTRNLMQKSRDTIAEATDVIAQVSAKLKSMDVDLKRAENDTGLIERKLGDVARSYDDNTASLVRAQLQTSNATNHAAVANKTASNLRSAMSDAERTIANQSATVGDVRKRVLDLGEGARKLFVVSAEKLAILADLSTKYQQSEQRVKDLLDELNRLRVRASYARDKILRIHSCHQGCNPTLPPESFCPPLPALEQAERDAIAKMLKSR